MNLLGETKEILKIVKQTGDTVEFVATQLFENGQVDMMSVNYHDGIGSQECDLRELVDEFNKTTYTAICFEGFTEVGVFAYVGNSYDADKCDSCKAPAAGSTEMVAYYFRLSCDPICVDESETSTEESPTPGPKETISGGTPSPVTATPGPQPALLDCYDENGVLEDQSGSCPLDMEPISTNGGSGMSEDGSTVTFSVTNYFGDGPVQYMAIRYPSASGVDCEHDKAVPYGQTMDQKLFTAVCQNGIAEIELFVTDPGFSSTGMKKIPDMCSPDPDADGCVYYYVLPCQEELKCTPEPTPAPQPTPTNPPIESGALDGCVRQSQSSIFSITPMESEVNCDGMPGYPSGTGCQFEVCITLDTSVSKSGESISHYCKMADDDFSDKNHQASCSTPGTWGYNFDDGMKYDGSKPFVSCQYAGANQVVTFLMKDGGSCTDSVDTFGVDGGTAMCQPRPAGTTSCSGNSIGKECMWTITTPSCPASPSSRRMEDIVSKEAFAAGETASGASGPSEDEEDVPYCVSEDFPCEGDGEDMVYVCHYSARKGYQTFCIPESDSDILRFYPSDYCGPCEGGYGGVQS